MRRPNRGAARAAKARHFDEGACIQSAPRPRRGLHHFIFDNGDSSLWHSPGCGRSASAFSSEVETGSRQETRQNKNLEPRFDSIEAEKALLLC
jgi:hypothetical protein